MEEKTLIGRRQVLQNGGAAFALAATGGSILATPAEAGFNNLQHHGQHSNTFYRGNSSVEDTRVVNHFSASNARGERINFVHSSHTAGSHRATVIGRQTMSGKYQFQHIPNSAHAGTITANNIASHPSRIQKFTADPTTFNTSPGWPNGLKIVGYDQDKITDLGGGNQVNVFTTNEFPARPFYVSAVHVPITGNESQYERRFLVSENLNDPAPRLLGNFKTSNTDYVTAVRTGQGVAVVSGVGGVAAGFALSGAITGLEAEAGAGAIFGAVAGPAGALVGALVGIGVGLFLTHIGHQDAQRQAEQNIDTIHSLFGNPFVNNTNPDGYLVKANQSQDWWAAINHQLN
jgi:hypothetical protein